MAILIPSKNIYDKQNPKVRDNVIERIEVGAVEIVPDNKYEEPIANIVEYKNPTKGEPKTDIIGDSASLGVGSQVYNTVIAYIQGTPYYYDLTIKIPLIKENSYISSLLLGVDDNNNANIKYSVGGTIKTGEVTATLTRTGIGERDVEISNIVKGEPTQKQSTFTNIPYKYSYSDKYGGSLAEAKATAEVSFDEGNIKEIEKANIVIDNGKEYYQFYLRVIAGVDIVKVSGGDEYAYVAGHKTLNIESKGEYEEYLLEKIEVTVYGNTIGIDLQDKTMYINGETAKKVHSIDGNELMQTSNYIKDENENITENAIGTMYGKTRKKYEHGKETATIRCSVGDYYDYDSGEKMIAIDKSTGKMSFKLYDQVIPMVYGADGEDHPMSTYQDGSAKVFQVLGSNIYYDGAVWQELSLQEVDKSEVL